MEEDAAEDLRGLASAGLPGRRAPFARPADPVEALRAKAAPRQIEKLVPQPQLAVAFGLLILKAWPIRSSTKSISEPPM